MQLMVKQTITAKDTFSNRLDCGTVFGVAAESRSVLFEAVSAFGAESTVFPLRYSPRAVHTKTVTEINKTNAATTAEKGAIS